MALPAWLGVNTLKRRLDREMAKDDALLAELLADALAQVQAPPPYGAGRLLIPDPPNDSDQPVDREITFSGLRTPIPDAREITKVSVKGQEVPPAGENEAHEPIRGYRLLSRDGTAVQLELPFDCHAWGWEGEWPFNGRREAHTQRTVTITGRFGFLKPPDHVVGAIYTLAARRLAERNALYADTVAIAEGAGVSTYFKQLPNEVWLALRSFALPSGIAGLS
jgi:hypothetical protein